MCNEETCWGKGEGFALNLMSQISVIQVFNGNKIYYPWFLIIYKLEKKITGELSCFIFVYNLKCPSRYC